jgi:hypothetical protein
VIVSLCLPGASFSASGPLGCGTPSRVTAAFAGMVVSSTTPTRRSFSSSSRVVASGTLSAAVVAASGFARNASYAVIASGVLFWRSMLLASQYWACGDGTSVFALSNAVSAAR